MSEIVNTNLEKLFFAKIIEDPNQFYKVLPFFFRNEQIRFVYEIIRDYYIQSKDKIIPSPKQIWAMLSLHDTNKLITKESFKSLMTENTEDLNEDWFLKRFKAWKTSNHSRDKVVNAIDLIKKMEDVDYDNVIDIVSQLKQSFNEIDIIDNDDDDLGDDFDDPESHKQNISLRKIPTGFSNMDKIMGGGWDHATFNVLMGETNVGKCLDYQTVIKIRNKNTNVIKEIRIGDFFNLIKK